MRQPKAGLRTPVPGVCNLSLVLIVCLLVMAIAAKTAEKQPFPALVIPDGLGVNIHFQGDPPDLDLIAQAGFRMIRMDMSWRKIETVRGRYDFVSTGYDSLTEACSRRNLRILYIIDYGNTLYEPDRSVRTAEGRLAFASFAEVAAERYAGHGVMWEIWNEPNVSPFWEPKADASEYCRLVEIAAPYIGRADSTALIVAPAASTIPLLWIEQCFQHGLLKWIDAVSVHPYRKQPPETVLDDYRALKILVSRYASGDREIPIISSEWGYSLINWDNTPLSALDQAQYLIRSYLLNLYQAVPVTIWYDWKDDGVDPGNREHHFGTVEHDLTPKPAYTAVGTLVRYLGGYAIDKRLETESRDDYLLLLTKGPDTALVVWTSRGPREATLPLSISRGILVGMLGDTTVVSYLCSRHNPRPIIRE